MGLSIKKVSKIGTSHPVVARLGYQIKTMLEFVSNMDIHTKSEIEKKCIEILVARLGNCWEIYGNLKSEEEDQIGSYKAQFKEASNNTIIQVPFVIDLEAKSEQLLYESKNFLRDLITVFRAFYPTMTQKIIEASSFWEFDNNKKNSGLFIKWAIRELGANHKIVQMLHADNKWIGRIIQMRNAVEHPKGCAGELIIHNFRYTDEGSICVPVWYLKQNQSLSENPSPIVDDMKEICEGLLSFSEELLIFGAIEPKLDKGTQVKEIPFDQRSPECPVRFRVVLCQK